MGSSRDMAVFKLRFPARSKELAGVRRRVEEEARARGADPDCACDIVMAVDEACQNIIRHAYRWDPLGTIELEIDRQGEDLVISLLDFAPPIDPKKVKPRDLDKAEPGGIGTHLIRSVMDRSDFLPAPSGRGNLLRMVKKIA